MIRCAINYKVCFWMTNRDYRDSANVCQIFCYLMAGSVYYIGTLLYVIFIYLFSCLVHMRRCHRSKKICPALTACKHNRRTCAHDEKQKYGIWAIKAQWKSIVFGFTDTRRHFKVNIDCGVIDFYVYMSFWRVCVFYIILHSTSISVAFLATYVLSKHIRHYL